MSLFGKISSVFDCFWYAFFVNRRVFVESSPNTRQPAHFCRFCFCTPHNCPKTHILKSPCKPQNHPFPPPAFALLFAFNAALSAFLSTNFSSKLFGPQPRGFARKTGKMLTGSLMGILFFAAGFYLIIYYVSVHFLVIFKL